MNDQYFNSEDHRFYNRIDIQCRIESDQQGGVKLVLEYQNLMTIDIAKKLAEKLHNPSRQLVEETLKELLTGVKVMEGENFTEISKNAKVIPIREVSTKLQ